jgi:pimeloyl-ACP methyl ester carboxylesterase
LRKPLPGMHDDAQAIRTALIHIPGPVVVVGHSYGGIPVTQAIGSAGNVIGVVYLAAFMVDVGECLLSITDKFVPDDLAGHIPIPSDPRTAFYSDVADEQASRAMSKLVPQSHRSFAETVTRAGWREVPSAYIICTDDRSLPPEPQEQFSTRAGTVERLASGHSPFFSMPAELAGLIGRLVPASIKGERERHETA